AALGALEAGPQYCRTFTATLARVRRACLERLAELGERCQVPPAEGAFYLLARLRTGLPAMQVVERLIREHQVAVIPGTAFGLQGQCHLRIAYGALQPDTVAQGMDRLVSGLQGMLD
ncbi:MAG: aminotransferase class I/II-fold pyridoxal phosphate-dependent enzyme, partial [Candidatus Latescibacteria bacterium]|nr:aminotransferase class I/II-fold pyridoxal phosphate-dependent enzyme [Candidatus Latescibacterota bacterium]